MAQEYDVKSLLQSRIELCRKAAAFEEADRIPFISFFTTWVFFDAGYSLLEAERDPKKIEEATIRFQREYSFDTAISVGDANAYKVDFPLGNTTFTFDEEHDAVSIVDKEFMPHEDLPLLAQNIKKYLYETMLPSRYPIFDKNFDVSIMQASYEKINETMANIGKITQRLKDELGMPPMAKMSAPINPIDAYVNWVRGIKGMSIDMRRDKQYMEDAVIALGELLHQPGIERIQSSEYGAEDGYCFDARSAMLMHNFMNIPQFEKFYWPYVKKTLDAFVQKGKNIRLFVEGSGARIWDYFADYPKGSIVLSLDGDDVKSTRKALPNLPIMGGSHTEMLGGGTSEECIDEIKRAIDDADGIGFMVTQHKMVAYRNDCRRENIKAVSEWLSNYEI